MIFGVFSSFSVDENGECFRRGPLPAMIASWDLGGRTRLLPWGDKSLAILHYARPLNQAIDDAKRAMAALGTFEDDDFEGKDPQTGLPVWRIRGHFRYGLKRFGQKTRVHVYVLGHPDAPSCTVGVEGQGGDVWGTASKAGRERFIEHLGELGELEIIELP